MTIDAKNVLFSYPTSEEEGAEAGAIIEDMFSYHEWTDEQKEAGKFVREALAEAVKKILCSVPPSADRSSAIRKIREARMDCNSAITHNGKY